MQDKTSSPLIATPDRYLFAFEADAAVFLEMDRDSYSRSIFLDDRIQPSSETPIHVPISALSPPGPTPASGWIFHVAHCGSTLLARALDRPGGGIVLREPFTLRQLGIEAANGAATDPAWQVRLQLASTLLARRYAGGSPSIIKANVPVNFIIRDILASVPDASAILLYFPLADYLTAILRSPNHLVWLRNVSANLRPAIIAHAGTLPENDAERTAALWLAQIRCYAAVLAQFPNTRSLDAETLFNSPQLVIDAAATLFGQPIADADLRAIVEGPLFATYSKNPAFAFNNEARLGRQAALANTLAPDIERARQWVGRQLDAYPLPVRLERQLVAGMPQRHLLG